MPCGSVGEESTCSVGDLGSIPGLRRPPGKGGEVLSHCAVVPSGALGEDVGRRVSPLQV